MSMKALSIIPVYAMDILEGYKTVECRSWKTQYRGTIVICSSSRKQHRCICGHALCLADIVDIVPFSKDHLEAACMNQMPSKPSYAWMLNNIRPIVPVPVKGKLSLWNYDGKVELLEEKEFRTDKEETEFWDWYDSLYYLSSRELKYEKEHPELFANEI